MQAFATKPRVKKAPEPEAEPAAQVSQRAVAALEVASVIASVFITTWVIIPLQLGQRWLTAVPALLAVALMVNSHRLRGERPAELGFTFDNFWQALRLVALPTVAACAVLAAIGFLADSFHRTSHFWSNFVVIPAWGLTQQYVLQAFIFRRMRFVLGGEDGSPGRARRGVRLAILMTAAIFSLTHLPNFVLMVLTFLGALLWSWVYDRAPNLWALGLSHAAISLMLMTSLPAWLLPSMSVGYKHFLYQKF